MCLSFLILFLNYPYLLTTSVDLSSVDNVDLSESALLNFGPLNAEFLGLFLFKSLINSKSLANLLFLQGLNKFSSLDSVLFLCTSSMNDGSLRCMYVCMYNFAKLKNI